MPSLRGGRGSACHDFARFGAKSCSSLRFAVRCEHCKYDLTGLVPHEGSVQCPECGYRSVWTLSERRSPEVLAKRLAYVTGVLPALCVSVLVWRETDFSFRWSIAMVGLPASIIAGAVLGASLAVAAGSRLGRSRSETATIWFPIVLGIGAATSAIGVIAVMLFAPPAISR